MKISSDEKLATWQYRSPTKILFGPGRLKELPRLANGCKNILMVTTPGFTRRGMTANIVEMLTLPENRGIVTVLDNVAPNPDLDQINNDYRSLLPANFDFIIGLGGGSAIDSAKVLSYLLAQKAGEKENTLRRQFEAGTPFKQEKTIPLIAIPTTAGTGSEVTPFATVWDKEKKKKYSLATEELYPHTALLDPALMLTLPEEITVYTALDALSHAFEAYWNNNGNPLSDLYAVKSIKTIIKILPLLQKEGENISYRAAAMEASLFAGLAIATTRTALAHSISYPVTARYGMPHGLACSFTLPAILAYNSAGDGEARFGELLAATGCKNCGELKEGLDNLFREINIMERVKKYIAHPGELQKYTGEMFTPGRADNNIRAIDEEEIKKILQSSLTES